MYIQYTVCGLRWHYRALWRLVQLLLPQGLRWLLPLCWRLGRRWRLPQLWALGLRRSFALFRRVGARRRLCLSPSLCLSLLLVRGRGLGLGLGRRLGPGFRRCFLRWLFLARGRLVPLLRLPGLRGLLPLLWLLGPRWGL